MLSVPRLTFAIGPHLTHTCVSHQSCDDLSGQLVRHKIDGHEVKGAVGHAVVLHVAVHIGDALRRQVEATERYA